MAQSIATIDDYIESFPPDVRVILNQVRRTIHQVAPGAVESISYNIPALSINGRRFVHFASWQKYISIYPVPRTSEDLARQLQPHRAGKGTLRFPLDQPMPYELIAQVAKLLAEQRGGQEP